MYEFTQFEPPLAYLYSNISFHYLFGVSWIDFGRKWARVHGIVQTGIVMIECPLKEYLLFTTH